MCKTWLRIDANNKLEKIIMQNLLSLTEDRLIELLPNEVLMGLLNKYISRKHNVICNINMDRLNDLYWRKDKFVSSLDDPIIDNYIDFFIELIESVPNAFHKTNVTKFPKLKHTKKNVYIDTSHIHIYDDDEILVDNRDIGGYIAFPSIEESRLVIGIATKYNLVDKLTIIKASIGDCYVYYHKICTQVTDKMFLDIDLIGGHPFYGALVFKVCE